jgi:hypothetical protein
MAQASDRRMDGLVAFKPSICDTEHMPSDLPDGSLVMSRYQWMMIQAGGVLRFFTHRDGQEGRTYGQGETLTFPTMIHLRTYHECPQDGIWL